MGEVFGAAVQQRTRQLFESHNEAAHFRHVALKFSASAAIARKRAEAQFPRQINATDMKVKSPSPRPWSDFKCRWLIVP